MNKLFAINNWNTSINDVLRYESNYQYLLRCVELFIIIWLLELLRLF